MGVSGLHVEVRGDGSILQGHEGVEEGDVLLGPFCRELDGGMCVVEFLHKAQQCLLPVAPDGKDVVDVTPPDEGLDDGGGQDPLLKLGHEDVGIGGGHPSAHGRSVDLDVVLLPEDKAVFCQNFGDQSYQVLCWWPLDVSGV